jgi:hypothetical protein
VRIEIAVATAEDEADATGSIEDPLFRLRLKRWAMPPGTVAELIPVRDAQIRVVEFDYDVSGFLGAQTIAAFPAEAERRRSYIVAFGGSEGERRDPLLVDELTVRILRLSDGTRTAAEIVEALIKDGGTSADDDHIAWIEELFLLGLLSLRDTRVEPTAEARTGTA